MGLMDAEYFRGCVENHALVRADERCRPVLNEVLQLLYDRDVNSLLVYSNPLSCPACPTLSSWPWPAGAGARPPTAWSRTTCAPTAG